MSSKNVKFSGLVCISLFALFSGASIAKTHRPDTNPIIIDDGSSDFVTGENRRHHRRHHCILKIRINENLGRYFVSGILVIPGLYNQGGVYDPSNFLTGGTLQQAQAVASSPSYHSQPCVGQQGGYPSCATVRVAPLEISGNLYTGRNFINCRRIR
jgi:hypothetical protein